MSSQQVLRKEIERVLVDCTPTEFSRKTGVSLSNLSNFLSGRRVFRRKAATKYFKSILNRKSWSKVSKEFLLEETLEQPHVEMFSLSSDGEVDMTEDQYQLHIDPLYAAIIMLFELEDFQSSVAWMSKKMSIPKKSISSRLERLVRLGLIEKNGEEYKKTGMRFRLTDNLNNKAMYSRRLAHFALAKKAALLPPSERDFFDITFAGDPENFQRLRNTLRELIKSFDRQQMEARPKKVYTLLTMFFPISK